jgi:uncharacterized membrane protein
MSLDLLRGASLVTAIASTGFVAAIFVHWSNTVMPALRSGDDRFFVMGFKALNSAILNPLFIGFGFVGAVLLTGLAALLQLGASDRAALPWIVIALLLYLVAVGITVAVHLPLNAVIERVADPAQLADPGAIRAQFREERWALWNHLRAGLCVLAFACLGWALFLFGRGLPAT